MKRQDGRKTLTQSLIIVMLCLASTMQAVCADEPSLAGKNIYPRNASIQVRRGTETIATGGELTFPIVARRQVGNVVTVWVNKTKQEGEIQRQDVLSATEAIPVFAERFAQNSENLYAAFILSLAWEDLDNLDQAVGVMTQALNALPNAIMYNRRGNLWQRKHAFTKAIRDYNASLKLDPTSVSCIFNRGLAWSLQGNQDKAIADFNTVLKLSPLNAAAYLARGSCWKNKGVDDKAISDYTTSIVFNADEPMAYQERATLWYRKGDYTKALADYNDALRLHKKGGSSTAYLNRGLVWVKLGLYGRALADFDQAVRRDVRNSTAYNNRGWIRATCPEKEYRNGKLALADARRACELANWNNPYSFSTLGEASAEVGDFASAIHWQNRASQLQARLNPSDTEFQKGAKERLECYQAGKPYRESK